MPSLFPHIKTTASLNARNVAMSRGDAVLFSGLSTVVNSGDILWIQGDNGIGKTTLLEALAGLSRVDDGEISWQSDGQAVPPSQLIAYQPHQSFAKATLTAREDLSFWAKIYAATQLIDDSLNYVGLTDKASVPTQNLSAGQRRRLALAKLIISQKPIWIMDEPAAAMDIGGADLIDKLVSGHIARGGSAIIASHSQARNLGPNTRKLTLRAAP